MQASARLKNSSAVIVFVAFSLLPFVLGSFASAQTYKVLHRFTGNADGGFPLGGLIRDANNNLYGTSTGGNTHGTIFHLTPSGKFTVLYTFTGGSDGGEPDNSLVRDSSGNLFGTTRIGGKGCFGGDNGCGVAFELSAAGKFSVLHRFAGVTNHRDGAFPTAGLLLDGHGNLAGTTSGGGISTEGCQDGAGTVFTLKPTQNHWTETILHRFTCSAKDGEFPFATLTTDPSGDLFGTTFGGGSSCSVGQCGNAFRLIGGSKYTLLYTFQGSSDGAEVYGGLVRDPAGNLYGTAIYGGASGFGIIFKLNATGHETILHSFTGSDGAYPYAGLIRDSAGNLYGTTHEGGSGRVGTVYKLDTSGHLTVLHNFAGGSDGAYPFAPLLLMGRTLYGTTNRGGPHDAGTVFKVTP